MKAWLGRHKVCVGILAVIVFSLVIVGIAGSLFRLPLLRAVGAFLLVEDEPVAGDALVLFNGDADSRALHVAKLYERGLAPRILIARAEDSPAVERGIRPNDTAVSLEFLRRAGVPDNAVLELPEMRVTSTWDEARATLRWVKKHPVERLLVVTTRLHARRTRWALRRACQFIEDPPEILMVPAEHWDFDSSAWWQSERGVVFVVNEYLKLVYYWFRY